MPLTEEERKRLAQINAQLGGGLTEDEEARLLDIEEELRPRRAPSRTLRVPRAQSSGGETILTNVGRGFYRDVKKQVPTKVIPLPRGRSRSFGFEERIGEGPFQNLQHRAEEVPDVRDIPERTLGGGLIPEFTIEAHERKRPGARAEELERIFREKSKRAVSGVDFLTGLAGIPSIGEQFLTEAEETQGGGQRRFEEFALGAPLDIAAFGGLGSLGKAGVRAGARGALQAGVSQSLVRKGLKQATTFPTIRKVGRAIAATETFKAAKRRLTKPLFEFGQPVDVERLSAGVPSQEIRAAKVPGAEVQEPLRRTVSLEPGAPAGSSLYVSPSQLTKRTGLEGFDVDPLPIYSNYSKVRILSEANKKPFTQQVRAVTGVDPDVNIKLEKPWKEKVAEAVDSGGTAADVGDVLRGQVVVDPGDIATQIQRVESGFEIHKLNNFFDKPTDFGYRGVNAQVRLPNGQVAELQIHTPQSLAIREKIHPLYEKWRRVDIDKLSPEEYLKYHDDLARSQQLANEILGKAPAGIPLAKPEQLVDDPATLIAQEGRFQRAKTAVERAETVQGPLPKKVAGRRTLEKMGDTESSRRVINEMGKEFEAEIQEAGGRKSIAEIEAAAEIVGIDPLLKREMGAGFSAAEQRALTNAALDEINKFTDAIKRGSAGDAAAAVDQMLDLQFTAVRATSESARATRMAAEVAKSRPIAQRNLAKLVKEFGGKEGFTAEMRRYLENPAFLEDPQLVGQFIRNFSKASTGEKLYELWINSILSALPTHVVNNTSNTVFFAMRPLLERPAAAAFDLLASGGGLIRPRQRFFGESFAELIGLTNSLKMSPRALWESYQRNAALGFIPRPIKTLADPALAQTAKTGRGAFQEAAKAFETEVPAFGITKFEGEAGKFGKASIKGTKGRIIRFPGRGLVAADEFYKNVNVVTDLHARAYRQAAQEAASGKIKRGAIPSRMAEIVKNPTEEMLGLARAEAIYRTFQKELGTFGKKVQNLRDPEDGVGQIFQYVIPFVRTPVNIAKAGVQFTPLNWLRIAAKQSGIKKFGPKFAAGELQDEMAKATVGSMLAGGVYLMALEGDITGSSPRNPKERAVFFEKGKQPRSIRIGNHWIPYGRLEPVGMSMGIIADFMQNRKSMNPTDVSMALSIAMAKNVTNKTYAKGLAKAIEAMTDPERGQENLLESFAGSLSPNIITRLSKAIDPTLRDPKGVLESLATTQSGTAKALASGLEAIGVQGRMIEQLREFSELVGPVHTMWGERVRFDEGVIGPDGAITGPLMRMVSPGRVTLESTDSTTDEVNRLAKVDTAAVPPSAKFAIQKFERDRGKRLPTEVIDTFATGRGREYKARADDRMARRDWGRKTDEQKIKSLRRIYGIVTDRWRRFLTKGKVPRPYKGRTR